MVDEYSVVDVPIEKVFSDDEFNCRGVIPAIEVTDLAQDIQKNKLQFPIAVQPQSDVKDKELPEGKEYRIVAGHRRFKAWSVLYNSWQPGDPAPGTNESCQENPFKTVPCMIKLGLNEVQARVLNLGENLKRKDLNILQEAKAIQHLREAGVPRDSVAEELGMSSGWVQTRYYLLDLPEEIQEECAAGIVTQTQIKQLYSLRDKPEEQYEAVKKIKEAKSKGEKIGHVGKKKKQATSVKKERKRPEMFQMIELLAKTPVGYGLATRALAWAAGQISTEEFFVDVKRYCTDHNLGDPRLPDEF